MIIDNTIAAPGTRRVARRPGIRRVGIAGAGWVTQYHLPAWFAEARRAEVVAIADPDVGRMEQQRGRHGIPMGFGSVEAMIADADIDILDVCAPREMHAPLVRLGGASGLAVLCQKPLAPTLRDAEALVSGLDPATRVMVHDNWRFRATYRRLKQWLDAGYAGELRRVELHYLSSGMIPDATGVRPAIVRQPIFPTLSRLLVMEALIHQIDALRFLFGELTLLSAVLARSNDEILGEDSATLTLRRTGDKLPVELVGNLAVHGEPPQARDQLRIFGSRATLTLDGYDIRCVGETNLAESFDPSATYDGSYANAIAHFLDCLDSGAAFETSPGDNLKTLAIAEAAYALTPDARTGYAAAKENRGRID